VQQPSRELLDSLQSLHGRLRGGAVQCGERERGGDDQPEATQQSQSVEKSRHKQWTGEAAESQAHDQHAVNVPAHADWWARLSAGIRSWRAGVLRRLGLGN
jgi:hypothetical protein